MSAVLSDADVKAIKRSLSAVCTHEEAIQATARYLATRPTPAPASEVEQCPLCGGTPAGWHAINCPRADRARLHDKHISTPAPASDEVRLKDHEIALLINQLRDAAVTYRDAQQLRARISMIILPLKISKEAK